jgi:CMP/dCMP kinase
MIVTIDGPAGAGKSSVAKRLADALGFEFLDTGAMYRCVTWECMSQGINLDDLESVARVAQLCRIDFSDGFVHCNGKDVTTAIREQPVTVAIKQVADNLDVRSCMVQAQRNWARGKDAVTEGRDQGTVAFPHAECKIFLTASAEERASRRVKQLHGMNQPADYDSILAAQRDRDQHDISRPVGALVSAADAVTVNTDGMTEEQVLARLIEIVQTKKSHRISEPHFLEAAKRNENCGRPQSGQGV